MKTPSLALGLLAAALYFATIAQAEMVSGALKFYSTTNGFGMRSFLYSTQPLNDPYVDLTVKVNKSKSLTSFLRFERILAKDSGTIPYSASLYVVPKGAVITRESLAKNTYKRINANDGQKLTTALVGRDFWLVMDSSALGSPEHTVISWIQLRFNAQGQPEMIDHISAYDEPGIVVGQKTPWVAPAP